MKAQLTVTVSEAKQLIAKAISYCPEVTEALQKGKVLLKGGTTVSAVAEALVKTPLRISGRITPRGASGAQDTVSAPHSILIEQGKVRNVDKELEEVVLNLRPGDVVVCGANLIDNNGNAAIMAGSPLGGPPGRLLAALEAEGITTLIAAGLEKLGPNFISKAIKAAGRKGVVWSMGMATGLIPVPGRLITEVSALTMLASVKVTVIGRGGIEGAEGATTMVIDGDDAEVRRVFCLVYGLKGAKVSGVPESLLQCQPGTVKCAMHEGCIYRGRKLPWK